MSAWSSITKALTSFFRGGGGKVAASGAAEAATVDNPRRFYIEVLHACPVLVQIIAIPEGHEVVPLVEERA